MRSRLKQLIDSAGPGLCSDPPTISNTLTEIAEGASELIELLDRKNGFYAFGGALHVLPSQCPTAAMDLERWNSVELWRGDYGEIVEGLLFFAEDVFGVQFGVSGAGVCKFDPESGEVQRIAQSIEEWAGLILDDSEFETGYPLLEKWTELNGPLPNGKRLLPKTLFILGGEYRVDNLYALDAAAGMRFRADLWGQLKDVPDGSEVRLIVINHEDVG